MFRPPDAPAAAEHDVDALAGLLRGRQVTVLTGAGCSTESGIPDYRSPAQLQRVRRPIQHQEFIRSARTRARYWARSLLGWPRFSSFVPNPTHASLARLEQTGHLRAIVTQNVDGLHQRAGSQNVLELHGALSRVRCVDCGGHEHRDALQERLAAANPGFAETYRGELRPDGDAELPEEVELEFCVPACRRCDGVLKPDVVFFGDNVAPTLVRQAMEWVETSEVLLVVGTSLAVYSGYRFVLRAVECRRDIAVVNVGPTRADGQATLRVEGLASDVLPRVVAKL